jgi:2-dehydro-3-deoxygalactonokinase
MASSNIGMLELPYKPVPVNSKENDFVIKIVEASDNFKHKMLVISGVKTSNDVMRGEETQLIGCLKDDHRVNQYFIFTGTHSKHVLVENEMIVDLKTYMTGEFFSLLSKKSVLSSVIEEGEDFRDENNMKSFEAGVKNSLDLNLLHSAFLVRTNHILGKLSKRENFFYLSGLLIGSEIKDLPHDHEHIVLVSNKLLTPYYAAAFKILNKGSAILKVKNIDEALLKGQFKIYSFYSSLLV